MKKISMLLATGFCALLFGGLASNAASAQARLQNAMSFWGARTERDAFTEDAMLINKDLKRAQKALFNEREKQ